MTSGGNMTVQGWSDLSERQQRRAVISTGISVLAAWVLLFGAYSLLSFSKDGQHAVLVRLVIAIVVFVAVLAWEVKEILRNDLPGLRAARAIGVLMPVFLVSFSSVYLTLDNASASHFNQPLNHVSALYFTVTVFSSVGFGDISPRGNSAQLIVSVQMLLDLAIIAVVARVLIFAAKTGRSRKEAASAPPSG